MSEFFDKYAPTWDKGNPQFSPARKAVVFIADVSGKNVLDIACGTGVMFPEYLEAGAKSITGVDLSPEMVRIAREKVSDYENIEVICEDVLALENDLFDTVVLYNGYPHFLYKESLVKKVSELLVPGGRFTVAHGMSRDALNRHHDGLPANICTDLLPAVEEAKIWHKYFKVDSIIDTDNFYLISGRKAVN